MSQELIRVLHIVNNLNFGGMERIIAEIVRRTNPAYFETHVLVLHYLGHFAQGLDEYATLHIAPRFSRWSMIRPTALSQQIEAIAPSVVHMHSGAWYKASLASRMARVPYLIYTDHGRQNPDPWLFRTLDGFASRHTDAIVAVSDALAKQLTPIVSDPTRIRVIANGVDTERYAPTPGTGRLHHELGISADTPIIGSVGRLEPVKGYDVMVAAFAQLLRNWPADRQRPALVLIGDGSQRELLENKAKELGITQDVHIVGFRDDIEELLHDFTLFSMSSHSEGTSVSLLEAMSSGLCPVVTRVGGNPAVLGDAMQHRLVPPNDPAALATAWRAALDDPDRRAADAVMARERVISHFSLGTMVRNYEELYTWGHRLRVAGNAGTP